MKDKIKGIVQRLIWKTRNVYLTVFYRRQIKRKFLKKADSIDRSYEKEALSYWKGFGVRIDPAWHRWYTSRNHIKDVRYIPEDFYYCRLEPFFNRAEFNRPYEDKSFYSLIMPDIQRPVTIGKNISGIFYDEAFRPVSAETIIEKCMDAGGFVIKPSIDSGGGRSVRFVETEVKSNAVRDILNEYKSDYIIQEMIIQHEELGQMNPESVNTVRSMSFLHEGEVHILSSILRMGINGSRVDNESAGGISVGITDAGYLKRYAFDKFGTVIEKHPQGVEFYNKRIPGYEGVVSAIKKAHHRLAHFKIVSWDFAIDSGGNPVLIEYNLYYQGLNFHQLNNGPLFGELTDGVLEMCKSGRGVK